MINIRELLDTNHYTFTTGKNRSNGVAEYRLADGCMICQTRNGHIYIQGKLESGVIDLLSQACPWECLQPSDADDFRKQVCEKARETLLTSRGF